MVGDDGQPMDVGGRLPQALLVALALAEGRPVPADQLLDQVWAGPEFGGRNRLQVHISRLRKMLGSDRILTRAGGYSLAIPGGVLDAARFGQLAADGRAALQRQDPAAARRLLRQALGLWRGRPLAEFADTGFAPAMITRLEEARLTATEDRIEAELMLGGQGELTGELEALVGEHPLRERLWGQLILALYRAGRQGDALGAYQRARAVLADELGVDPGPELRKLEAAVLGQDPALDAPAAVPRQAREYRPGNLPAAPSPLIGRAAELGAVASTLQWTRPNDEVDVLYIDGAPVDLQLPSAVDLEVTETEPGLRGDTASGGGQKPATLETGAQVQVPLFVNVGDRVRVDTRSGDYVSRA